MIDFTANSLTSTATGLTTLGGVTSTQNDTNVVSGVITTVGTVQSAAGDITLDANTGALTLAAGTDVQTADGSVALTGTTGISLGADVTTGGATGTVAIHWRRDSHG